MISYCLPISCSILYLATDNMNPRLVTFACLFLDFKFLSFFRLFEKYNMYFSIILRVATKLVYFLVFLVILVAGFAHAFFILLRPTEVYSIQDPTVNTDANNPWNLVPKYYQTLDDGTITNKIMFAQGPDENTNMFTTYGGSLFAMYLFLSGTV